MRRLRHRAIFDQVSFAPLFISACGVSEPHEVEPARFARGSTHQDSIEALTGNRCSSLTFGSRGGAEFRTRRPRNRERQARTASLPDVWARGMARGIHGQRLRPREVVDRGRHRPGAQAQKATAGRNQTYRRTSKDTFALIAIGLRATELRPRNDSRVVAPRPGEYK